MTAPALLLSSLCDRRSRAGWALPRRKLEFSSPLDVGIDRAGYFERCCPHAGELGGFELRRLIEAGNEVLATYVAARADGTSFRNAEVLTFRGNRVCKIEVYFGWSLD